MSGMQWIITGGALLVTGGAGCSVGNVLLYLIWMKTGEVRK